MKRSLVPAAGRWPRILDRDMESIVERFFAPVGAWFDREFFPRTNMSETDRHYEFSVELPAMRPEDIQVEVKDNSLWISGEKQAEQEDSDKTYHYVERHHGTFRRVFPLPGTVNADEVQATYANGLLTVTVPKVEEPRPKQVAVTVTAPEAAPVSPKTSEG